MRRYCKLITHVINGKIKKKSCGRSGLLTVGFHFFKILNMVSGMYSKDSMIDAREKKKKKFIKFNIQYRDQ